MGELVAELVPLVRGARLKDVHALPPRDLVLVLDPPPGADVTDRVLRVRLSANPDGPRLHLVHGRLWRHKGPEGPFFRAVADELVGGVLREVAQVGGDRIVSLGFRTDGGPRELILELAGRQANLILLDGGGRVLALLAPVPGRKGQPPRLTEGAEYAPPGGVARPPKTPAPPLAEVVDEPDEPAPGPWADAAPLSWRVEAVLGGETDEKRHERLTKNLVDRATRKLGRARGLVQGLEERASASAASERVLQDGELLKANLAAVRRGMDAIELDDWYVEGTPPRRIALDPKRSPQENVTRLFDRYHKLERAHASVAEELERARAKVAALEDLVERAGKADADPEALEREAVAAGLIDRPQVADPRKRKAPAPRLPYKSYRASDGSEIRVGRSARDNDKLTFRHARGNDLWLHTADCPGSHVVLRVERGVEPDPEAVLDAALLAMHFSPARDHGGTPVHVARCKEVHKPRGAKPGLVTLSGGRILQVRAQQARLDGLLRSARDRQEPSRGGSGS